MDFVSRLKLFMDSQNLASTQFADMCMIPRPTVSQILNGRNKKISDELIGKIHRAFPQLSVLWLMFGEGNMESDSNIQFSEPKNINSIDSSTRENTTNQDVENNEIDFSNVFDFSSEKFVTNNTSTSSIEIHNGEEVSVPITRNSSKKIQNIVVLYDDNTFETFLPTT